MSCVCSSCGIENIDDTASKCVCGAVYQETSKPSKMKLARKDSSYKMIHVILIVIFLGGLIAGYFWVPALALMVDLALWIIPIFIPIESNNKHAD